MLTGVLVFVAAALIGQGVFDAVKPFGFEDPDSEGAQAHERYEELSGINPTPGVVALVQPGTRIESPQGRVAVRAVARELSSVEGIGRVRSPTRGDRSAISSDGEAAYVLGFLSADADDPADVGELAVQRLGNERDVTVGGLAVAAHELNVQSEEDLQSVELFAAPILLLLCFWVFRSVVAAVLPLLVGAFAIVATLAIMDGLAKVIDIDVFSINIVSGLGLGLAIDYSLLIVARYREELARLGPGGAAVRRTVETAGRTVAFSAVIVAFALAALLVFPQRFLYSTALGGAFVVLITAVVALTVLPAVLAMLGERINALAPPRLRPTAPRVGEEPRGAWYRLARFVMRRPIPVATASTALMIAVGLPFLNVDLTAADARDLPAARSARQVDDVLRTRFDSYSTTPMVAVVDATPEPEQQEELRRVTEQLEAAEGVEGIVGPRPLGAEAQQVAIFAGVDPLSEEAQSLLHDVRAAEWPGDTLIGGRTADLVDQKQSLESHLPVAAAIVAVLTLVTLCAMTGSAVLPFVALIMNVLTISAAFGILVLIFQDARFESLLDYTSQGALDSSMVILVFAVAFGLSTDYGVFLLTRIKELRDGGANDSEAVAIGLERTGRVVTAAALLFGVAIGAFVLSDLVIIKETAIGLAAAVLIDATIIRALLLPALMKLLGGRCWWAPRPIARLYERLGLS